MLLGLGWQWIYSIGSGDDSGPMVMVVLMAILKQEMVLEKGEWVHDDLMLQSQICGG